MIRRKSDTEQGGGEACVTVGRPGEVVSTQNGEGNRFEKLPPSRASLIDYSGVERAEEMSVAVNPHERVRGPLSPV